MPGHLISNPMDFTLPAPNLFFRDCVVGGLAVSHGFFVNSGDADLTIGSVGLTSGIRFNSPVFIYRSDGGSLTIPFVLPVGVNLLLEVRFSPLPGDEDQLWVDTVVVGHTGDNGPAFPFAVICWARKAGQALFSMTPWAWNFSWLGPRNLTKGIDIGDVSNVHDFQIVNTGDRLLTISFIRANYPFMLVDPLPVLPTTLSQGSALTIHVRALAELSGQVIYNGIDGRVALEILTSAGGGVVQEFVGAITGLDIVSAFSLIGATKKALAAFGPTVRQFDTTDLVPERPAQLVKVIDMQKPHQEKLFAKLRARYEDLGAAKFKTTIRTRDETSTPVTTPIGTAAADGLTREALVDAQLNEQVFKLTLDHVSGPLSFVDFGIDHEPRGPVVD